MALNIEKYLEKKHAPGPWKSSVDDDGQNISIEDKNGDLVLGGCGCCGSPFTEPQYALANVAVMTAAPELLEALEDCVGRFVSAFPDAEEYEPIKRARAAIAKAKGEVK